MVPLLAQPALPPRCLSGQLPNVCWSLLPPLPFPYTDLRNVAWEGRESLRDRPLWLSALCSHGSGTGRAAHSASHSLEWRGIPAHVGLCPDSCCFSHGPQANPMGTRRTRWWFVCFWTRRCFSQILQWLSHSNLRFHFCRINVPFPSNISLGPSFHVPLGCSPLVTCVCGQPSSLGHSEHREWGQTPPYPDRTSDFS